MIDKPDANLMGDNLMGTVLDELKEFQLEIYRKEYPDKSDAELIHQLSLSDEDMVKRLFHVDQLQVVREGDKIVGATSSKLILVDDEYALYIPYSMIHPEAQGRKLHVKMVYETALQAVNEVIWSKGILSGLWHMLTKGLPVVVRTPSKMVTLDLMKRTSRCFIPTEGSRPEPRTERIIRRLAYKLGSRLDNNFIFRNVYEGRINLKREDRVKLDGPLGKMFAGLGEKDAIPVLGYLTLSALRRNRKEMRKMAAREKRRVNLQV